jgi:hypothetical protein
MKCFDAAPAEQRCSRRGEQLISTDGVHVAGMRRYSDPDESPLQILFNFRSAHTIVLAALTPNDFMPSVVSKW